MFDFLGTLDAGVLVLLEVIFTAFYTLGAFIGPLVNLFFTN